MRNLILLIIALAGVVTAKAYDYPYLTFQSIDGTEQSVSVESLTITYADGKLVLVGEGVNQELHVAQLNRMFFSTESSSIQSLTVDNNPVEVYNLLGVYIGDYTSIQHALSSLCRGVYVMKIAGETYKIVVQ